MNMILVITIGLYALLVIGSIVWENCSESFRAAFREKNSQEEP